MLSSAISKIEITNDVALVIINNIPNNMKVLKGIFNVLAVNEMNIDMISQTAPFRDTISVSFTLPQEDLEKIVFVSAQLKKLNDNILTEVNGNNTKIVFSGEEMKYQFGVAASVFDEFSDNDIPIKLITTSETEISCLIDCKDLDKIEKYI